MADVIAFIQLHAVVLAALGVAVLDFLFALIPTLSANGILHQFYLWLKSLGSKTPPAA